MTDYRLLQRYPPLPHRKQYRFCARGHVEFRVDIGEMSLHGVIADVQRRADLFVAHSFRGEAQDFEFAFGQRFDNLLARLFPRRALHQLFRNRGRERSLTRGDRVNGVDEFIRTGGFQQIAARARLERGENIRVVVVRGENEDTRLGKLFFHAPRRVHSVEARHLNIEHGNVGLFTRDERERFFAVARFADDANRRVFFEKFANPFAHNRVVVGEDNAY